MKILAIADEESKSLWEYFEPEKLADTDLIISCGDLNRNYLEFLVTFAHCPLLYVHGNHDGAYLENPPEGCDCIEDRIFRYRGLRILGLGGSLRYKDGPCMYTENQMRMRAVKAAGRSLLTGGIDLLVTHSPARGYGDMDDLPHRGYTCFNTLLDTLKPTIMLHGHVHQSYGHFNRELKHPSGARIINASEYTWIEL